MYDIHSDEQTQDGIISVNNVVKIEHNPVSSRQDGKGKFWAQVSLNGNIDTGNYGGYNGEGKIVVTLEKSNLTLNEDLILEMKLNEYSDGISTLFLKDMSVNVYLVYLNNNTNYRDNPGVIIFRDYILGVGIAYNQTLYFEGSTFASHDYPSSEIVDYTNKLEDRRFEPVHWNNGVYTESWNTNTSGDWYQVNDTTFTVGLDNGKKGDFFRIITGSSNPKRYTDIFDVQYTSPIEIENEKKLFSALNKWTDVLAGQLPSGLSKITLNVTFRNDDDDGTLGGASNIHVIKLISSGNYLPNKGDITFNTFYGVSRNTIIHEVGHVLGIGILWDEPNYTQKILIDKISNSNKFYVGENASKRISKLY